MAVLSQIILPITERRDFVQTHVHDLLNTLTRAGGSHFAFAQDAEGLGPRASPAARLA